MFDFIFDLFRREKPLYRWRERPSLSAFMTNVERKQKPLKFYGKILTILGTWWVFTAAFFGIWFIVSRQNFQTDIIKFLEFFIPLTFVLAVIHIGLNTFSNFEDRIIELFDEHLRFQGIETALNYRNLEYFAFTEMVHSSSSACYPCIVFGDRSPETLIIGIPNPEVARRVTEILSSRMTFRTHFEPIMLEDEKI